MRQQAHQRRRQEPAPRLPVDLGLRDLVEQPGAFEEERAKSLDSLDRTSLGTGPPSRPIANRSGSLPRRLLICHVAILAEFSGFSRVTLTILVTGA